MTYTTRDELNDKVSRLEVVEDILEHETHPADRRLYNLERGRLLKQIKHLRQSVRLEEAAPQIPQNMPALDRMPINAGEYEYMIANPAQTIGVYVGPCRLTITDDGELFVMTGPSGKHHLGVQATPLERLNAHWMTFLAHPKNLGEKAVA